VITDEDFKTNWNLIFEVAYGPLAILHPLQDVGQITMGELSDMYNGYIWRLEREQQKDLAIGYMQLTAQGAEAELEDLMGRPPYPVLRALQEEPTIIKLDTTRIVQTPEGVQQDLAELKEIFRPELEKMNVETGVPLNPASQAELDSLLGEAGIINEPVQVHAPPKRDQDEIEQELADLKEVFKDELEGN
jgi:hypothetical protein